MSAFPATRASFVGEATFSGCIALCARSRSELEAWLPAGARLAEGASRVAFAFGTHSGSATRFAGFDLRLGIVYHELGVFVPGVIREGGSEPELYVARMYSSYYPAVWNGNTHYGFAKEHVEIHRLGALYCVLAPDRRPLLEARSEPTAAWRLPAQGAIASLDEVREIFALPVVGRLAGGRLVRSHFQFEFGAARVRQVDACVEIAAILAPGVRPGTYADGARGSVEVQNMVWRLSWPER